ncbi:hypothetical protein HPB48_013490 [Haemaphysalis longicornis]|uniref:Uncharacterized protein n=1 Tax=Haemaphysalis longicornis TaxID=44386 RepID=A0A9J6GKN3_HAELO|nr:hypothetical protein HPB48_013490 [Haemaphysalis longicornis]
MMSVDETLMCSFQILKPSEKKAKYQYGGLNPGGPSRRHGDRSRRMSGHQGVCSRSDKWDNERERNSKPPHTASPPTTRTTRPPLLLPRIPPSVFRSVAHTTPASVAGAGAVAATDAALLPCSGRLEA